MAGRNNKIGLEYFELDCHMDSKIRLIQAEFGLKGFAVFVKLLQEIYGEHGYYCEWTQDKELLFASENGLNSGSSGLLQEILSACIRRDIFSEKLFNKYGILTSSGVQKQYLKATVKREVVSMKKEYLLIDIPENRKNVVKESISVGRNSNKGGINKQSREEKSREEKSKEKNINICSESKKSTSEPEVISLILSDKSLYPIYQKDIDEWKEIYPAVDIIQELRKMKGWCNDNPVKRKTKRGIRRFIGTWLSKEQDNSWKRKDYLDKNFISGNESKQIINEPEEDEEEYTGDWTTDPDLWRDYQ